MFEIKNHHVRNIVDHYTDIAAELQELSKETEMPDTKNLFIGMAEKARESAIMIGLVDVVLGIEQKHPEIVQEVRAREAAKNVGN